MKTFKGILLLMFSIILMSVSCKKDDLVKDGNTIIFQTELIGEWGSPSAYVYSSYSYPYGLITGCSQLSKFYQLKEYGPVLINLTFSNETCTVTNACTLSSTSYSFKIENNILVIGDRNYVFNIVDYNRTTKVLIMTRTEHPLHMDGMKIYVTKI